MLVTEIPRFTADVLRCGAEYRALDGHASVSGIVVPRRQEPLDGESEQDDTPIVAIEVPARHLFAGLETRDRADLEPDVLQLWPRPAEELHGRSDGEVESVEAAVEWSQRRSHDLAAAETPVSSVACTAPRGSGGMSGAAAGHDESLGGARITRRGIRRSPGVRRTLAEMDGRLCSKVGCAREAVATLTYDYGDQMAALGPLGAANDPQAHDLCSPHADRLSVPAGWLVVRHEALRA